MKVWHIKGPKVVLSDQNLGFRGFYVRGSPHFSSLQVTESYAGASERGFISPIICHSELPVYAEISCMRQYSSGIQSICAFIINWVLQSTILIGSVIFRQHAGW